jgi:ribosomal protein S27AE
MAQRCPKGHWYEPDPSGKGKGCPQCATQTQGESSVSDDDVLAIMDLPQEASVQPPPPDAVKSDSGILRRKKICPECSHEASYSFVYCPRCGAPLKLASLEL